MKKTPLVVCAGIFAAGLMMMQNMGFAKPAYSKKEKTGCATCHVTAKSKELNDVGKCYHEKKDLKECAAK
ncbi:MAG: hypothetical protein IANPNBLG_01099 [Bryobacteraceae bacterium]|nr:hypothetical protein [Bryobacteraceae bacterium]